MCVCFGKSKIGVPAEKVVLLTRCRSQHEKHKKEMMLGGTRRALCFQLNKLVPVDNDF